MATAASWELAARYEADVPGLTPVVAAWPYGIKMQRRPGGTSVSVEPTPRHSPREVFDWAGRMQGWTLVSGVGWLAFMGFVVFRSLAPASSDGEAPIGPHDAVLALTMGVVLLVNHALELRVISKAKDATNTRTVSEDDFRAAVAAPLPCW
ncbi:hypothetical protein G7070_07060 [Propioniciclava coleopterorum]|uniref:Uncharacterized protein n=1 Tax=Propioniciclava coleopterorum TaxID=2714937 RepID=A0A6G7Y5I9_9ACTN|nr:hypothetical protein [Propioniciclava coleopterorum]QIK72070.1 hypothetical protein G7070_07060 [Propioniciclava coleopterorum]